MAKMTESEKFAALDAEESVGDAAIVDALAHASDFGEDVARFFAFAHLPPSLRTTSRQFARQAAWLVVNLPSGRERTKALDALLVAKDAAVRAALVK